MTTALTINLRFFVTDVTNEYSYEMMDWIKYLFKEYKFDSEEQAFDELLELAQLANMPSINLEDTRYRFVAFELENFYLPHCKSMSKYWYLVRDIYCSNVRNTRSDDTLDFLRYWATHKQKSKAQAAQK